MFFNILLFVVHILAILFPILIGIKSIDKFKYLKKNYLLPFGFSFLGLAAMFELLDHFKTDWLYIDHSSIFNWFFYSFLSLGLTFLSVSVTEKRLIIFPNIIICLLAISMYWIFGKFVAILFQVPLSIFLIINWQKKFNDWIFIAYPFFGIFLTTLFGNLLSNTSNQIWHIFIGPSGTLSVITFFIVLRRYNKKFHNQT